MRAEISQLNSKPVELNLENGFSRLVCRALLLAHRHPGLACLALSYLATQFSIVSSLCYFALSLSKFQAAITVELTLGIYVLRFYGSFFFTALLVLHYACLSFAEYDTTLPNLTHLVSIWQQGDYCLPP